MITQKMTDALNKHLNAELYSSYLYLSMASYASSKGLSGAGNWFYIQAKEEMVHVQLMYKYMDSQSSRIILDAIEKPPAEFGSVLEIFEAVLSHEQLVTSLVNDLMSLAEGEKDHATATFLQWFVTEQTEEEKTASDIIDKLKLAGDTGPGLYMVDTELLSRSFTLPAVAAE